MDPTKLKAWGVLSALADSDGKRTLRSLFGDDPNRFERFSFEAAGLFLDVSKARITDAVLTALLGLADEAGLPDRRRAMFAGAPINETEGRSVLHVALRDNRAGKSTVDG